MEERPFRAAQKDIKFNFGFSLRLKPSLDLRVSDTTDPMPNAGSARYSQNRNDFALQFNIDSYQYRNRNSASSTDPAKNASPLCTKSGHPLVDGLHSIENTCTYKRVFSIDEKNRKRTTGLFFDSFLSFSGWCGVRGSSGVTFLIERLGRRVSEGL